MAGVEFADFSAPDEVRGPDHVTIEIAKLGGGVVGELQRSSGRATWCRSTTAPPVA